MLVFLLRNLFNAGAGETRAMIVIAEDELTARKFASTVPHGHNSNDEHNNGYGDEGPNLWGNSIDSSCEPIGLAHVNQKKGVLMTDFVYD